MREDVGDAVTVVPRELLADRRLEADSGLPTESRKRGGRVERDHWHVVGGGGNDGNVERPRADMVGHDVEDFLDGVGFPARYVEHSGRGPISQRTIHEIQEIAHVEEVAGRVRAE